MSCINMHKSTLEKLFDLILHERVHKLAKHAPTSTCTNHQTLYKYLLDKHCHIQHQITCYWMNLSAEKSTCGWERLTINITFFVSHTLTSQWWAIEVSAYRVVFASYTRDCPYTAWVWPAYCVESAACGSSGHRRRYVTAIHPNNTMIVYMYVIRTCMQYS